MNSFLRQIESRFTLLESADLKHAEEPVTETDKQVCDQCEGTGCMHCDYRGYHEGLEEMSTTGGIAGYQTPRAFGSADDDTVEALGYKRVKESVNTPATYEKQVNQGQRPESEEEEMSLKFAWTNDGNWQNADYEYPSKNQTNTPGVATKKHKTLKVHETMEKKYEELLEGYRAFATGDPKVTPEQRVNQTIREIAKKLQEIEEAVRHTSKLKTESGMARDNYKKSTKNALDKISERLIKISERVRSLGE